jgi:branched-chain amino acid transport system ATP-binding protein
VTQPFLALSAVEAGYGEQASVLCGIDLQVDAGEVVCLLGRNGAGKTTTIRAICGLLPLRSGTMHFDGKDITNAGPTATVAAGIAVVPEGRRVFPTLTVEENLFMGAYSHRKGIVARSVVDEVYALFPRLAERRRQLAGTLSGGEQQMVAMGRALMVRPRLLLLDEPSMGLAPLLIELVFDTINTLAMQGITILLVEQNATAALDVADRGYVIERGRVAHARLAADLEATSDIRSSYLGS